MTVTPRPLGYLFWHGDDAGAGYDEAVRAWHAALADHPPPGLGASWTWRLPSPPWLTGWPPVAHLDVYVVGDFADLGTLNRDAPSGPRAGAHDRIATRSVSGSGAVMACVSGPVEAAGPATLAFFDKPRGAPYPETVARLAGPARSVWLRQMVLGAGPELLVVTADGAGAGPPPGAAWAAPARLVAAGRPATRPAATPPADAEPDAEP